MSAPKAVSTALADALQCDNGGWSCMRMVTALVCLAVLSTWIGCCIAEGRWINPSWEMVTLIGGSQGAKAVQYRFERRAPDGGGQP